MPQDDTPAPVERSAFKTVGNIAREVLGTERGLAIFQTALDQLDEELEDENALQLLLVLMIDQIEEPDASDRFITKVTKALDI